MFRRSVWLGLVVISVGWLASVVRMPEARAAPETPSTLLPSAFLPVISHQPTPTSTPTVTPTPTSTPSPGHLGYGANVADAYGAGYLADMGFDWAKGFADPADRENIYGPWQNVANQLNWFLTDEGEGPRVRHVLLRIRAEGYSSPPLGSLIDFRQRCHDLATFVKDRYKADGRLVTAAYEIWNEPNLRAEWGGRQPSPGEYVSLLAAAYEGVKSGDPQAIVVSAGLATGGDYSELAFLERMYEAGAAAHFDALGSHPYGGDTPPHQKNAAVYFRRAEEQRAVMEEFGDAGTPVWATEFSWIVERPDCDPDGHSWAEVTETQQADYLVSAYQYAHEHWPWMGPMFLILDFGVPPYYSRCEPLRWYSIYYRPYGQWGTTPLARPAVGGLTAMEKHSAWQ
jgi:hypothetical protein